MGTLNCKRAARMISLYVAGDLVGAPEREVAAHLAACDGCRQLAEGFSESSSLLTEACAPPEFGAEFYAGIRCAVLGEIASDQMLSKPSFFRPRWLYATAFAAIVIVCAVMLLHFVSSRRQSPDVPMVKVQPTSGPTEVPSPRKKHEPGGAPVAKASKDPALVNPRGGSRHFAGMRKPDAFVTSQTALVSSKQLEPAVKSSTSLGPVALEASSQISRIEIQTADPNIRIIWLSPPESREPDGTKQDQDRPETSNRK